MCTNDGRSRAGFVGQRGLTRRRKVKRVFSNSGATHGFTSAQMRPWLATLTLTRAQVASVGYDPELGVDRTLEKEAAAAGKEIRAFETASEQLGFLSGMPDKVAAEMLIQTLDELDDLLTEAVHEAYDKKTAEIGPELMHRAERMVPNS